MEKFPVAFEAESRLNSDAAAGEKASTRPVKTRPCMASTVKLARSPTAIPDSSVSRKLAMTQISLPTRLTSAVPAVTYWPSRTLTCPSRPSAGAWITVFDRSICASSTAACAEAISA